MEVDGGSASGTTIKAAAYLPVHDHRYLPASMRARSAIHLELRNAPGRVRCSVEAHPMRRDLYALNVWRDGASVARFIRPETHLRVMAQSETWRGGGAKFVGWSIEDRHLAWTEGKRRLAATPDLDRYHVKL